MGVPLDWLANPAQNLPAQPQVSAQDLEAANAQRFQPGAQPQYAPQQAAQAPQQAPMPMDANGTPLSPDMGGLQPAINPLQPINSQSPQAPSPQKYGLLKRMLTGAAYQFGQSMIASGGGVTDMERQQHQAQMAHMQAQTQQIQESLSPVPLTGADGQPILDAYGRPQMFPRAVAAKMNASIIAAQSHVQGAQIGAQAKTDVAHINQGQGVPVDSTIANLVGMPEVSGQPAGKALWANINSALKANGYQYKDLGQDGLWLMDRAGNKIKRISDSPSIQTAQARGQAFAKAKAEWSPFETVDNEGTPTTISAADAIKTGATKIGAINLANNVSKPKALIDDIHGGIGQVKQYSYVLDRGADVRTKVAALMADPGITAQTLAQSPIAASMKQDEQQYVINLLNLKENAMAMRSVLGAGQGSEDLRSAITKTIPNAATPNSQYANAQLDTFTNTLDRLAKGIPQLNGAKPKASPYPQQVLPDAAASQLVEGKHITFANGQTWTKQNGKPVRLK